MQYHGEAKTEQQKRKPLARLWFGAPGPEPRFRIEGVRGWIYWTRCGMGL